MSEPKLSALLEAIIYLAEEPVRLDQIQKALPEVSREDLLRELGALVGRFEGGDHGIEVREVAGGYRFSTKPEHHEVLKAFARSLIPPTRLSLAALETLAVIAYRQPITIPEIQEIRGVQASGVIKTLLDRKLVTAAGRKEVIGRPILYKTTRNFLIHFGLKDLSELPSIEEFEELLKSGHAEQTELPPEGPQTAPQGEGSGNGGSGEGGADAPASLAGTPSSQP
jgi:segregation and condensation protein B